MKETVYLDLGILGDEVPVDVVFEYTPGRPGRYYGPPEDCYPDEGPEWDIHSIHIFGVEVSPLFIETETMDLLVEKLEKAMQS